MDTPRSEDTGILKNTKSEQTLILNGCVKQPLDSLGLDILFLL